MIIGTSPFRLFDYDVINNHIAGMIDFGGPLPKQWLDTWQFSKPGLKEDWQELGDSQPSWLEFKFDRETLDPILKILFVPVIRGLTMFRPQDRVSALGALEMLV